MYTLENYIPFILQNFKLKYLITRVGTLGRLPVINRRKAGMTSSPHGPYGLGYTRATMAVTVGS